MRGDKPLTANADREARNAFGRRCAGLDHLRRQLRQAEYLCERYGGRMLEDARASLRRSLDRAEAEERT